jgi:glycosyltransferase involved in cell wall biosynthesis
MNSLEQNPPRRVLVIAYYFPPFGLSGVQRTLKFVKYLPQFGWHPTVLTIEPVGYFARDESLLSDMDGRDITVVRTAGAGPGRLVTKKAVVRLPSERTRKILSRISDTFFIPDNKIGWRKKAVQRALGLHRETPFDLVFATAPPFTDLLIGAEIKHLINKPLVLDYRDPWLSYPFKFYPTPLHWWGNYWLEKKVLRASSHIITTNRRVKEDILQRYPFLSYNDIDIIPQGFDPEDFAEEGEVKRPSRGNTRRMTFTYAGVFWEDRVPDHFLQALHDLFHEEPDLRKSIVARFIGNFREENLRLVDRLGLKENVEVLGYLSHKECIRHLRTSDVLWVIVGDQFGSPGKTYEYIGAGKPILGCAPEGYLKATILEAGGRVVAPADVHGIKNEIRRFHQSYQSGTLRGPSPEVIEKYDRILLTGNLVKLFESLFEP